MCVLVLSCFSHVQLFATPWTVACQAPLFMGFSRQEYWSELPFASPGDLPELGIKLESPVLQTVSLPSEPSGKPRNGGNPTNQKHESWASSSLGISFSDLYYESVWLGDNHSFFIFFKNVKHFKNLMCKRDWALGCSHVSSHPSLQSHLKW